FVIVSAEYNHSVPPALKNIVDYFMSEFSFKPSAIVTYSMGSFGGVRAMMQWRPILAELGMPSIPTTFPIPNVHEAFDEEGNPKDEKYHERIKRFLDEFDWYIKTFKAGRENGIPH
ncbi:NADPH-dependent FMN reductase, partial [Candidatus Pacearchaeota archaeon CG_4_9_14_0_2_um_filter_30_8]